MGGKWGQREDRDRKLGEQEGRGGRGGESLIVRGGSEGELGGGGGGGGVKGQNIPSAPRVGQKQQSCITGKHLGSSLGGDASM